MEMAARGRIRRGRQLTREPDDLALAVNSGHRRQQRLRIGMLRIAEHFRGTSVELHHFGELKQPVSPEVRARHLGKWRDAVKRA